MIHILIQFPIHLNKYMGTVAKSKFFSRKKNLNYCGKRSLRVSYYYSLKLTTQTQMCAQMLHFTMLTEHLRWLSNRSCDSWCHTPNGLCGTLAFFICCEAAWERKTEPEVRERWQPWNYATSLEWGPSCISFK